MRYFLFLLVLVSLLCIWSCQKDEPTSPGKTAQELVAEGWQKFSTRDYQGALTSFNQAISTDGSVIDAYNGAGWSYARVGDPANAVVRFNSGATRDANNLEIQAGLAFVYNAQKNYAQSITNASSVLQSNSGWIFSRDHSVTAGNLHVLLAEDYYAQANYSASLLQVQTLNPSFNADVTTISGQTALGQEIERLRSIA